MLKNLKSQGIGYTQGDKKKKTFSNSSSSECLPPSFFPEEKHLKDIPWSTERWWRVLKPQK